jgi:hypothetical protein
LRNSHPERDKVQSWFESNYLPIDTIKLALDQCVELGFTGGVCLSHYNEPLMDERLPEIARLVKSYNRFDPIFLNSNGDFLTEELAQSLDGVLDRMLIALYMDEPKKSERARWIESIFHTTDAIPLTQADHIPTHFSPKFNVQELAKRYSGRRCGEADIRVIINHRSQYLLCCDDVVGNFDLGYFPEISIKDMWFGERRTTIANNLKEDGGRHKHPYCATCPRI